QADGTESVVWERKAAAAAGRSVFAALSTATSLADLEARQAAFQRLPSVSDVQSVLSVLPDRQSEKLAVLGRVAEVADSVRPGALRGGVADRRSRRHRATDRRLRVDAARRAGVPPGTGVCVRARRRHRGAHDPPSPGDRARDGAPDSRNALDARDHATGRADLQ